MNLIDSTLWTHSFPWGNSLDPYFCIGQPQNVQWEEGSLKLYNKKEFCSGWIFKDGKIKTIMADYSYGLLVSKEQFHYGVYTVVCKLPNFRGSWPAPMWFYPVTVSMKDPIEMDFEHFRKDARWLGTRHKLSFTYHDSDGKDYAKNAWSWLCPWDKKFITVQFVWKPTRIAWVVNGKTIQELTPSNVKKFPTIPMNLIVNSGMGNWNIQDNKLEPLVITKLEYISA